MPPSPAPVDADSRRRPAEPVGGAADPVSLHGLGVDIREPRDEARRATAMIRRLELIGQAAGMGFWSLRRPPQGVYWGQHMYALHGLEPEEPPPSWRQWLRRHVLAADRRGLQRSAAAWLRHGGAHEFSFRLLRADGRLLDVTAYSRVEDDEGVSRPFGIVIDMTARRATEAALRKSAEHSRLIASAVGLGSWEHDLVTDAAVWDEQMWRLRGLQPQPAPLDGAARRALVHPDDQPAIDRLGLSPFDTTPREYEFRVRWPDGRWHWLASRSVTQCDANGRPLRRLGLNWDITEIRSARDAQQAKLAAQRELQAKSQFLSRMSHELRTPLNAVLGFAQLLQADADDIHRDVRERRLEQILGAGRHLLALIDDVLDLSRLEGGEMSIVSESVDISAVVASALPLVEPLARAQEVELHMGPLNQRAMADPQRLRQVVLNLLTNAIKYNHRGGRVTIEASGAEGVCVLRVSDTGRGLDRQQLEHLFEPFNRLGAERGTAEGTGIGLAIVKALVERMGGTIQVQSAPGEGSHFELKLRDGDSVPVVSDAAASPEMLALAAMSTGISRTGSIVYIEDNPVNAMILVELVQQRGGLTVQTAETGLAGLALIHEIRPDLVLLDMQLPDLPGEEVFKALQSDPAVAGIPVIALSANALPADIERAKRAGFADYWTKPLDFRLFHTAVETMFGPPPR